jgi:HrpA-like RNA helicase
LPTVIIVGETGSGKTTQIPQYLLESRLAGTKSVAVTQPRRVAAVSIASRVAAEYGTVLGETVGYSVRFEPKFSRKTKLKYLTDGMLLRELLSDALLSTYAVVILDEAHERTLRTDILFGMLKGIQSRRSDPSDSPAYKLGPLKIVVMSATLDAEKFSSYFSQAPVLYVAGRQFPVKQFHTPAPEEDYLDAAMIAALQIHREQPAGDILVFLAGQEEIEALEKLLHDASEQLPPTAMKLMPVPLFASLPNTQQAKVFDPTPSGIRKCVLATNIAETSVTIPGIRYVIDSGVSKIRSFDPRIGLEALTVQPVSKASARQRAGRAGREAAGACYRLFTEQGFNGLPETSEPEIKRVNLAGAVLQLKASGVEDIEGFDFMDPPARAALLRALEGLFALGALGDGGKLTDLGRRMCAFPLDPPYAKIVIESVRYGCTREILFLVGMLSVENVFHAPSDKRQEVSEARQKFSAWEGDHLTLLNIAEGFDAETQDRGGWCLAHFVNHRGIKQAMQVREQMIHICREAGIDPTLSCGNERDRVLRAVLSGFVQNVAFLLPDGSYRTVLNNQTVAIHPSSQLHNKKASCVAYNELLYTNRQYMRTVSRIEQAWLVDAAPDFYGRKGMDSARK